MEYTNPNEIISRMIDAGGGPCVLDKIYLPYNDAASGPAAKFGLGAELYLPDIDRTTLCNQACNFLTNYWNLFPEYVNEFLAQDAKRTKRFKGDPTDLIRRDCGRFPVEMGYGASIFGAVDIGLPADDVEPYQAQTLVSRIGDPSLSFVQAAMPVCKPTGEGNIETLLGAVVEWAQLCQPVHGSAGFTFIVCPGMEQNSVYALQMMKRFPGFDFPETVGFTMASKTMQKRIKCVNWLTVLSDELIMELGGLGAMRVALEPACSIHRYDGGVVIQAGPYPRLGDTQKHDVPAEYRMVATYTRSIRFEGYRGGLFRVPANLDKREEALAWVRRFD